MNESPLITAARRLLSRYTDAEILTNQSHTTPDEPEILARLRRVDNQIAREFGCGQHSAHIAVTKIVRERRKAARKETK